MLSHPPNAKGNFPTKLSVSHRQAANVYMWLSGTMPFDHLKNRRDAQFSGSPPRRLSEPLHGHWHTCITASRQPPSTNCRSGMTHNWTQLTGCVEPHGHLRQSGMGAVCPRVCGGAAPILRCTCTSPPWCAISPRIEPAWGTPRRHTQSRQPWLHWRAPWTR